MSEVGYLKKKKRKIFDREVLPGNKQSPKAGCTTSVSNSNIKKNWMIKSNFVQNRRPLSHHFFSFFFFLVCDASGSGQQQARTGQNESKKKKKHIKSKTTIFFWSCTPQFNVHSITIHKLVNGKIQLDRYGWCRYVHYYITLVRRTIAYSEVCPTASTR